MMEFYGMDFDVWTVQSNFFFETAPNEGFLFESMNIPRLLVES